MFKILILSVLFFSSVYANCGCLNYGITIMIQKDVLEETPPGSVIATFPTYDAVKLNYIDPTLTEYVAMSLENDLLTFTVGPKLSTWIDTNRTQFLNLYSTFTCTDLSTRFVMFHVPNADLNTKPPIFSNSSSYITVDLANWSPDTPINTPDEHEIVVTDYDYEVYNADIMISTPHSDIFTVKWVGNWNQDPDQEVPQSYNYNVEIFLQENVQPGLYSDLLIFANDGKYMTQASIIIEVV